MKSILYWSENKMKRVMYKKYLLEKDIQMAIQDNTAERVLRIVPKHSKDIFIKELKRIKPELVN